MRFLTSLFCLLGLFGCSSTKQVQSIDIDETATPVYTDEALDNDSLDELSVLRDAPVTPEEELQLTHLNRVVTKEEVNEDFLHPDDVPKDKIDFWVHFFTVREKARFQRFLNNGERYKDIVLNILKQYKLPSELFYVAMIESGYYTKARSHAAAVGPWQFIRGTARTHGLRVDRSIDERVNIFKATHAAAKYLTDLYNIFGSWELALSAYNAGENKIIRTIRKQNTRDFKELCRRKALPRETINYIPKLLAAIKIARNKEDYGLSVDSKTTLDYASFDRVTIRKPISVRKLAKQIKRSKEEILKWNPDLKWDKIYSSRRRPLSLILPSTVAEEITANPQVVDRSRVRAKDASPRTHVVKRGESVYKIAKMYGMRTSTLRRMNNLRKRQGLIIGQRLKLQSIHAPRKVASSAKTYKVRRGDTLSKLAKRFKTTVSKIRKQNKLRNNRIAVGQMLDLPSKTWTYVVKRGDSLYRIARRFGVRVGQLVGLNALKNVSFTLIKNYWFQVFRPPRNQLNA